MLFLYLSTVFLFLKPGLHDLNRTVAHTPPHCCSCCRGDWRHSHSLALQFLQKQMLLCFGWKVEKMGKEIKKQKLDLVNVDLTLAKKQTVYKK